MINLPKQPTILPMPKHKETNVVSEKPTQEKEAEMKLYKLRRALEQIRDEIKDNQTDWCYNSYDPVERAYYGAYTRCLKIIDKYKVESEDEK